MRRRVLLCSIVVAVLMVGCGQAWEQQVGDWISEVTIEPTTQPLELKEYRFKSAEEVEQMSDEDLIYIAQNSFYYQTLDFFDEGEFAQIDLYGVELKEEACERVWIDYFWLEELEVELDVGKTIPEAEFERLVQNDIQMIYKYANTKEPGEDIGSEVLNEEAYLCGENDNYIEYSIRFTDRRSTYFNSVLTTTDIPIAYRKVYFKNYVIETNIEEWRAYLLGELSAEYVQKQLDMQMYGTTPVLYREVTEDEQNYYYTFYYAYVERRDYGVKDEAVLWKHIKTVNKETHLVLSGNFPVEFRRVEIEGTESTYIPVY